MEISEAVERFRSHLSRERYAGARYAIVAYLRGDALHNVCARITWLPEQPDEAPFSSAAHGLVIRSGWLPWESAQGVLETLPKGHASFTEHPVLFHDTERDIPYAVVWERDDIAWARQVVGWSAHCLQWSGPPMQNLMRDPRLGWLGDRLSSMRPGRVLTWRDVERIVGPCLEISESRSCILELFAPVCARLLDPTVPEEGRELHVPIESLIDPVASDMELVVQGAQGGELLSVIPAAKWTRQEARRWTAPVPSDWLRGRLDLSLSAGGLTVWRSAIAWPALPARLLDGLEGGLDWLERLLLPEGTSKKDADGFERAVVSLLALGGLPAVPIGRMGPDRASDVICAVREGQVILGECTIGPIAPKKVGEIRHRAEDVLSRLRRPGEQLDVLACVFTPAAASALPTEHLALAAQTGVTVVAREQLSELLALARSGELARKLPELIVNWEMANALLRPFGLRHRIP